MIIKNIKLFLCCCLINTVLAQSNFNIYKYYNAQGINYDTINKNDSSGQAHGHWIIINKNRRPKLPGYTDSQITEEGNYFHGKKNGVWISYYPEGNKKEELSYLNGRLNGSALKYYHNGSLEEKRNCSGSIVKGELILYDETGKETERLVYDDNGKLLYKEKFKDGFKYQEDRKENDTTEVITEFDRSGKIIRKYTEKTSEKLKGKF